MRRRFFFPSCSCLLLHSFLLPLHKFFFFFATSLSLFMLCWSRSLFQSKSEFCASYKPFFCVSLFTKIFCLMPPLFVYFYLFSHEATSVSEFVNKSAVETLSFCLGIARSLSPTAQSTVTVACNNYSFGAF